MIGNALNRVASAVDAAYSRWLEGVLGRIAGPAASPYAQGIQALIKGDFRVDSVPGQTDELAHVASQGHVLVRLGDVG